MINISCKYNLPEEIKYSKHEACKLHNYRLEICVFYLQEFLLMSFKVFSHNEHGDWIHKATVMVTLLKYLDGVIDKKKKSRKPCYQIQ